jgi:glycosyltransferase involved in cell wall biosynthesis
MKICHVICNLYAGGAQTFLASLAIEQKKLGHEVSVIQTDRYNGSPFEASLLQQFNDNGIQVFSMERKPGKNLTVFKSIFLLHKFIKQLAPDIINTHLQFTHLIVGIYLKLFKHDAVQAKYIATIHNAPEVWNAQTLLANKKTTSIYCSQASVTTSVSRDCVKTVIENGIKIPVVDNSADKIIDDLHINKDHQLILMVGKLSHQKNYPLAVQIAKAYETKKVSFLICGILEETSEQDLASFKTVNNIHYLGIKVPHEIYSLMDRCDCFLNTSHYEGLPITVLEAFFIGTPTVLSPILPHNEIGLNMANCYIPESFAMDAFVEKIGEALGTQLSKDEIKAARKQELEKYTINVAAKKYIDFYKSA